MDAVLRATAMYLFLLVFFRISGRRTLSEMTTFDFILLLIIAEATQQGLLGDDYSLTNAFLVIMTLVGLDIGLSLIKQRSKTIEKFVDGMPTILVDNGQLLHDRMKRARVDVTDILATARQLHGLERLEQIKYAVLEQSGGISIIPKGPTP